MHEIWCYDTNCYDDDDEEHDDDDDDDDVDSPPAAGSSTSPAIYATPASVGKRAMQTEQASNVKRPCMQVNLSSFFTQGPN